MRDLQVVAVGAGGTHIVVADGNGEQFRLPVDDRLRAAVRGDRVRDGQLEIALTSQLNPREIQTRVRAGASVEEVAEQAGVSPERVLRYAAPVLDERAHVARRAAAALIRTEGRAEAGTLGSLVEAALAEEGVAGSVTWDSWRRDDGRWVVVSRWAADGQEQVALWLLDPSGRSAAAHDDTARRLAGLPTEQRGGPTRLAVVRDEPTAPSHDTEPDAEDETPTGPIPDLPAAVVPTSAHPAQRRRQPRKHSERPKDDERLWLSDLADNVVEDGPDQPAPPSARRQRPPVPSWDEIMFGRRGS